MKATKLLPILAVVLCVPGIALRALHLLNGFDVSTGLPTAGDKWIWFVIALFAISAIVYAVLALPLKTRNKVPFEQLLGTKETLFRMAAVVAGLIVAAGSLGYLYLTITTAEQDVAAWARVLEIVYAIMGVLTGGCMISLAKAGRTDDGKERCNDTRTAVLELPASAGQLPHDLHRSEAGVVWLWTGSGCDDCAGVL